MQNTIEQTGQPSGGRPSGRREELTNEVTSDVFVFGLPFWNASFEEFFAWWQRILSAPARSGVILAFANANTLNQAQTNPSLREALGEIDALVNDGIGFRIASKMRGVETRYNLNGTDLIPRLFAETPLPLRVFIYGATEEANSVAAAAVTRRFPNVTVVGRCNGYVDPQTEAVPLIAAAEADVVLVALGHPKQELFCVQNRDRLNAKFIVPVGGLIDFLSEMKPRAPKLFRSLGLEWVYRLSLEPKRMFVRYVLGNPVFLVRSALYARRDRTLLQVTQSAPESLRLPA